VNNVPANIYKLLLVSLNDNDYLDIEVPTNKIYDHKAKQNQEQRLYLHDEALAVIVIVIVADKNLSRE